jgi:hypothetical protein
LHWFSDEISRDQEKPKETSTKSAGTENGAKDESLDFIIAKIEEGYKEYNDHAEYLCISWKKCSDFSLCRLNRKYLAVTGERDRSKIISQRALEVIEISLELKQNPRACFAEDV